MPRRPPPCSCPRGWRPGTTDTSASKPAGSCSPGSCTRSCTVPSTRRGSPPRRRGASGSRAESPARSTPSAAPRTETSRTRPRRRRSRRPRRSCPLRRCCHCWRRLGPARRDDRPRRLTAVRRARRGARATRHHHERSQHGRAARVRKVHVGTSGAARSNTAACGRFVRQLTRISPTSRADVESQNRTPRRRRLTRAAASRRTPSRSRVPR